MCNPTASPQTNAIPNALHCTALHCTGGRLPRALRHPGGPRRHRHADHGPGDEAHGQGQRPRAAAPRRGGPSVRAILIYIYMYIHPSVLSFIYIYISSYPCSLFQIHVSIDDCDYELRLRLSLTPTTLQSPNNAQTNNRRLAPSPPCAPTRRAPSRRYVWVGMGGYD